MKLSGSEIKSLRNALTDAYRSQAELRMLVRESDLGVNLEEIAFGENLNDLVFKLIDWADSENKLDILINAAYSEKPNNAKLKSFVENRENTLTANNSNNSISTPRQEEDINALLREFVNRKCPVIPVLLPTAPETPQFPVFVRGQMWVDFRQLQPEPMKQLIWGITGKKPKGSTSTSSNKSTVTFSFEVITVNHYGAIIKRGTRSAQYFTQDLSNNITLDMVEIPDGTFIMGAPDDEEGSADDERPQHCVTVQPFFIGKYLITQAQWRAVAELPQINRILKKEPSFFKGDNLPVEGISWYDAVEFCSRLSKYSGRHYRLPSEAEWEYACRAGTTTPFYFGDTITTELANFNGNYTYAFSSKGDYKEETTNVGTFPPNDFGLYDMHGNVWEWCYDDWHDDYYNAPQNNCARIITPTNTNNIKLLRGGSWDYIPQYCRSAFRRMNLADCDSYDSGFRVVCDDAFP